MPFYASPLDPWYRLVIDGHAAPGPCRVDMGRSRNLVDPGSFHVILTVGPANGEEAMEFARRLWPSPKPGKPYKPSPHVVDHPELRIRAIREIVISGFSVRLGRDIPGTKEFVFEAFEYRRPKVAGDRPA